MNVTRDFVLPLEDVPVSVALPAGLERPGVRRRWQAALDDLGALAEPAACWEEHRIEAILHERLQLEGGRRIGAGPLASVVAGADALVLAVCTLGAALDERIREQRDRGRYLEMMLLDELASWAVDQVRIQLYQRLCALFRERGWNASSPLSPGESSWPLREQRIVFKLVAAEEIGVRLDSGNLMHPLKSLTFAFGAGAGELGSQGLTACEYCSIQDRCRYAADRSRRAAAAAVD